MNNFSEMPFLRTLLVALVVLFVVGAGVPGGALARTYMANGHEGDPGDANDIVSGGGGNEEDSVTFEGRIDDPKEISIFSYSNMLFFQSSFSLNPIFEDGRLIWVVEFVSLERVGK